MNQDYNKLTLKIKKLGKAFGFNQTGITDLKLSQETVHFKSWVESNHHGDMRYFEKHSEVYSSPIKLLPNATRVICCRIDYPKSKTKNHLIASFAQIQDYSSHIRKLLKKYADVISDQINIKQKIRVFAGNAPILEKALAAKAGLGWYGKNSILINEDAGSYFFLGEILTDLPLPIDSPTKNRCGDCFKCKDICPTKAIIAPHKIDARRCISYLTIEHKGSIPLELRPLIGTRIYGCDACQDVCPWNKLKPKRDRSWETGQTPFTSLEYFKGSDPEKRGQTPSLIEWFLWDEKEFKEKTKDSPMHRISHECWLRNIAVALGNWIPVSTRMTVQVEALKSRLNHPSSLVREHVEWALEKLTTSF